MQYSINENSVLKCKARILGALLEEVREFRYLGSVLCSCGNTGEKKARAVQWRKVIGLYGRIMKEKNATMNIKKD